MAAPPEPVPARLYPNTRQRYMWFSARSSGRSSEHCVPEQIESAVCQLLTASTQLPGVSSLRNVKLYPVAPDAGSQTNVGLGVVAGSQGDSGEAVPGREPGTQNGVM